MKHILSTLILVLCAIGAQAQATLTATLAKEGDNHTLQLSLQGDATQYAALQMDIDPGQAFAVDAVEGGDQLANHTLRTSNIDGCVRVLAYSLAGESFAAGDGALLCVALHTVADDAQQLTIKSIRLVYADGTEDVLADMAVAMNNNPNGIDSSKENPELRTQNSKIYTLHGTKTHNARRGIYIVDGKKVVR